MPWPTNARTTPKPAGLRVLLDRAADVVDVARRRVPRRCPVHSDSSRRRARGRGRPRRRRRRGTSRCVSPWTPLRKIVTSQLTMSPSTRASVVGDAVADDLVHRRAQRLRDSPCSATGSDSRRRAMHASWQIAVELVGRDTDRDRGLDLEQHLAGGIGPRSACGLRTRRAGPPGMSAGASGAYGGRGISAGTGRAGDSRPALHHAARVLRPGPAATRPAGVPGFLSACACSRAPLSRRETTMAPSAPAGRPSARMLQLRPHVAIDHVGRGHLEVLPHRGLDLRRGRTIGEGASIASATRPVRPSR